MIVHFFIEFQSINFHVSPEAYRPAKHLPHPKSPIRAPSLGCCGCTRGGKAVQGLELPADELAVAQS